jgi:hypothetical protein
MQQAKQLAALGARLKTIHLITGMPPRQVQSLFFPDAHHSRGRAPDSAEWYHGANLILRTDACLIGARYRQLRNHGSPPRKPVFAYRAYQAATRRLTASAWTGPSTSSPISTASGWPAHRRCPDLSGCGCEFIAAVGTVTPR